MRIGVNCFLLQKDIGGIKQYFLALFDELLADNRGHKYVFFYFEHNLAELEKLSSDKWRDQAILLQNQLEIKPHLAKVDLYFCPFGSLWPRPLDLPTVVSLVDIQEVHYPQFFSSRDRYARAYHYVGSTKMADRVVTISDFSKKAIVKFHKISPSKIIVAHLCADSKYSNNEKNITTLDHFDLPEKYLFFPANRWLHKNHDILLKAIKFLKEERGIRIPVVLTGYDVDGGYPLVNKAKEYGIDEQVCSIGYVSVDEMVSLFRDAEMLVFPSLYEGFGIPLVEAMLMGCPVVASRETSLPEIGGDAALFFDPRSYRELADRIELLFENEIVRNALVAKGYMRAREFSAAKMADRHLYAFDQALKSFSRYKYFWNNYFFRPWHYLKVGFQYRKVFLQK